MHSKFRADMGWTISGLGSHPRQGFREARIVLPPVICQFSERPGNLILRKASRQELALKFLP